MRSDLITVLRTVWLNRGLNRYLFFWHRTVLEHKRTVIVRGSRFFRSDRTVRSGFQNHATYPMISFQLSAFPLIEGSVSVREEYDQ